MRNTGTTSYRQPVRTVSGRLTLTDTLPRFTHFPAQETPAGVVQTGVSYTGGKILRVGVDGGYLAYSVLDPALAGDTASSFYNATWTRTTTLIVSGSRPGLSGSRVFYNGAHTLVYYQDWNGTIWGAEQNTGAPADACAIASLSENMFFVVNRMAGSGPVYQFQITLNMTGSGLISTFPGYIYTDVPGLPTADAVLVGDTYYLYFTDQGGKRTQMVSYRGGMWSEVTPVVPLDVVDDTSLFTLSGVSLINGWTFITGVLKRKLGMDMHVYLQGPENAMMGRELFIDNQQTDIPGGKFVLVDDTVWYIGASLRSSAPATTLFGVDSPALTVQVTPEDTSLSTTSNAPFTLSVELPAAFDHPALRSGAEVKLEARVGEDYIDMGRYNIDAVMRPQDGSGKQTVLQCRSSAMKRLNQWRSDACYDYWSQTKLNANPKDLTKVLRVSGKWKERDSALSAEQLNVDGMMYLTAKAARGSLCRARFKQIQGDFKARFGVGVNFYRESKFEAAQRLGIDETDVTEGQYGTSGLFAVYGPVEYNGGNGIGLYWVENGFWNQMASAPLTFTPGTSYWLMLQAIEGHIRVFYRGDTTANWTNPITHDFADPDFQPWKSEQMGRGSLYIRPITPYSQGYSFLSDQDVIPVADNSSFPTTDVVMVDEEQIHYNGKSPNNVVSKLFYRYGDVVAATAAPGGTDWPFAYDRYHARAIQKFHLAATYYLRAIKVWARKVKYPKDTLDISTWTGPVNESIPIGTEVQRASIPSEKMSADTYDWHVARFDGKAIKDGDWVILSRGDNPTHPESATYYACQVSSAGSEPVYYWDEQNDLWVQTAYSLPMQIYASESEPGQYYSIYVAPDANLSHANNAYIDQALLVTSGPGMGQAFKIVGYTYRGNANAIFYVDRDPGDTLEENSVLSVVPTLKVARTGTTLDRGYNNTLPVAHAAAQVDVYRAAPYVESDAVQFYSSEKDYSLEEVAKVIARKAGIEKVSGAELLGPTVVPSAGSPVIKARNVIGSVTIPTSGTVDFKARMTAGSGIAFRAGGSSLSYYKSGGALAETFDAGFIMSGALSFSLYEDAASFWLNGRHLYTFTLTPADAALTGSDFQIIGSATNTLAIHFPEANIRIDNFILDAGRAGDQLLSEQIGEKRFFYQDAADGSLKLFMRRETVNTPETAYNLAVSEAEADTDSSLVTRIRLEGMEVAEKYDPALIRAYGNVYYQSNCREINSSSDADYYTDAMLEDFGSRLITKQFSGAADPRIEPGDQVWVTVGGVSRLVIVDSITFILNQTQDSALFDMELTGRIPRSELTL